MQNTLADLNNRLFLLVEELADPEKKGEIEQTISRAKAIAHVSAEIVDIHRVALEEAQFLADYINKDGSLSGMVPSPMRKLVLD